MKLRHIVNFNYYHNIEKFYDENEKIFSIFLNKISSDFDIPAHVVKDSIKRSLSEILEDGPRGFLKKEKVSIRYQILYFLVLLFFVFNIFLGSRIKKPKYKKIVFDGWSINGYKYFYKPFFKIIKREDFLIYVTRQHRIFRKISSKKSSR